MTKGREITASSEYKSMDEFRKRYLPKSPAQLKRDSDICVAAEKLAVRTIRSVRRQLAAQ